MSVTDTQVRRDQVRDFIKKGVYSGAGYPDYDMLKSPLLNNVSAMEVILNPGDAIFIPIAWWHRAESLDVSISTTFINFDLPNQFSDNCASGAGKQKSLIGKQSG